MVGTIVLITSNQNFLTQSARQVEILKGKPKSRDKIKKFPDIFPERQLVSGLRPQIENLLGYVQEPKPREKPLEWRDNLAENPILRLQDLQRQHYSDTINKIKIKDRKHITLYINGFDSYYSEAGIKADLGNEWKAIMNVSCPHLLPYFSSQGHNYLLKFLIINFISTTVHRLRDLRVPIYALGPRINGNLDKDNSQWKDADAYWIEFRLKNMPKASFVSIFWR